MKKNMISHSLGMPKIDSEKLNPNVCPYCDALPPKAVVPSLALGDQFLHERGEVDGVEYVRLRSDVSFLLHIEEVASRYGVSFANALSVAKTPKSSAVQQELDKMSDDAILRTIKPKNVQSASELLAYSQSLAEEARVLEAKAGELLAAEAERQAAEKVANQAKESVATPSPSSEQ